MNIKEMGTYVVAFPTKETRNMIGAAINADDQLHIKLAFEAYRPDKYHTTILYSRKHHPEVQALRYGEIEGVISGIKHSTSEMMFARWSSLSTPRCW